MSVTLWATNYLQPVFAISHVLWLVRNVPVDSVLLWANWPQTLEWMKTYLKKS
jgi:hypothetical protein